MKENVRMKEYEDKKIMDKEIIAAIIGAAGVIIAAIIGICKKKSSSGSSVSVNQTMGDGNGNTQIGVQNNGDD